MSLDLGARSRVLWPFTQLALASLVNFGLAFGKYDVTCEHGDEHRSEMVTLIREQALIIS